MGIYKCINCGKEKESKKTCQCGNCGYLMYAAPYEKIEVLEKEIKTFIKNIRVTEIEDTDLIFEGSEKDEKSFPTYEKIINYVCSAQKTEQFFERTAQSMEKIKNHLMTPFSAKYNVNISRLTAHEEDLNYTLSESLDAVNLQYDIPKITYPKISVVYEEIIDNKAVEQVIEILELCKSLLDKIKKFVRKNNIYNAGFQNINDNNPNLLSVKDKNKRYKTTVETLDIIIERNFTVDIFSDGTKELSKMVDCLWSALKVAYKIKTKQKKLSYFIGDKHIADDKDIETFLLNIINKRYSELDEILESEDLTADRSERELFEIYNKLIELDDIGYFRINVNNLIPIGKSETELNQLIGLSSVKENIKKIKAYTLANKSADNLNIHMCFYGNPGTGKTEVARIIAGILYENKILPTKKVVEVDRSGLVSQYVGETPIKTMGKINEAMGGVLFIDEAYALVQEHEHYGHEAVATLIKAMEDYRGKFCVILAGYKNQMLDMIASNPGFKSRIQFEIDFPNYSRDELKKITELMLKQRKYQIEPDAMARILDITDIKRKDVNFANAREIRNILDQVIMCQNLRTVGTKNNQIEIIDVNKYTESEKLILPQNSVSKILSADEELEQLVGLSAVKRMIKKIKAYAKRNKSDSSFNLHMCFSGNPGTGKTETARILSRLLYDAGVLPEAKVIETDASGLIGKYVGETAPKTIKKINEAMGGILFIDEAYALTDSQYGDEAVAALLKEMEDRRGQFCVILAGYKKEMDKLLSANPGFASRIQFMVDFTDYTREELGDIAVIFLAKKKYEIADNALDKVLDIAEYYRKMPDFANARTIRNILDQVIMNQNLRTDDEEEENFNIILSDVEDYITDEAIDLNSSSIKGKIGF